MEELQKKIIIVDDDDETRTAYAEIFRNKGFKVLEARDGVEGLDIATSEEGIDAIFTGIVMPRMDGFQMIEALKKHSTTAKIPIFINSHLGREYDRQQAMKLGVRDFIIRGVVTPAEAVQRILHHLQGDSYLLKLDPFDLDAQKMIEDLKLPGELKCENCGTNLAVELTPAQKQSFNAKIVCPECRRVY